MGRKLIINGANFHNIVDYESNTFNPSVIGGVILIDSAIPTEYGTFDYGITELYDVTGISSINVKNAWATNEKLIYGAFLSETYELVSNLTKESAGLVNGDVSVPSGAKYIMFNAPTASAPVITFNTQSGLNAKELLTLSTVSADAYINSNGVVNSSTAFNYRCVGSVLISGFSEIEINAALAVSGAQANCIGCFMDENNSKIGDAKISSGSGQPSVRIAVPEGANSFRFNYNSSRLPILYGII